MGKRNNRLENITDIFIADIFFKKKKKFLHK